MKHTHYLLLLEAYECRDCDEWLGIYHDDETLKAAYKEAAALLAQHSNVYNFHYQAAIYEFQPVEDGPQITYDCYLQGQRFRMTDPEKLTCFKQECEPREKSNGKV